MKWRCPWIYKVSFIYLYINFVVAVVVFNSPFYSYGCKRGWSWPCFDTILILLYYVNHIVLMLTGILFLAWFLKEKERGLYQNKVNISLTFIQRLGYWAHNCKMVYCFFISNNCSPSPKIQTWQDEVLFRRLFFKRLWVETKPSEYHCNVVYESLFFLAENGKSEGCTLSFCTL